MLCGPRTRSFHSTRSPLSLKRQCGFTPEASSFARSSAVSFSAARSYTGGRPRDWAILRLTSSSSAVS